MNFLQNSYYRRAQIFLIWSAIEDSSLSSIIIQDNIYLKNEKQERRRESNHQNQLSVGRFYCAVVRVKGLDRRTHGTTRRGAAASWQQLPGGSFPDTRSHCCWR